MISIYEAFEIQRFVYSASALILYHRLGDRVRCLALYVRITIERDDGIIRLLINPTRAMTLLSIRRYAPKSCTMPRLFG